MDALGQSTRATVEGGTLTSRVQIGFLIRQHLLIKALLASRKGRLISRAALVGVILAYGIAVRPSDGHNGIPCLWRTVFGFTCPGCGLSRAWAFFVRGHWLEAGKMNWRIFPVVFVFLRKLAVDFNDCRLSMR